ncbi:hypothetical protein MHEI_25730 [Mycobacterium heidelbergense]|nr:hypothetical protein MHEI_25730 [Mycobacterium heidelbergense]
MPVTHHKRSASDKAGHTPCGWMGKTARTKVATGGDGEVITAWVCHLKAAVGPAGAGGVLLPG